VSTQNCAGYEPEQAGGAGYLDAVGATVENLRASESPKFGIITGLGHAMGDFALGGRGTGFDLIWAWPSAELGIADTRGFAGGQSEKDESRGPWQPAEWSVVDDVIKPSESRAWLARALRLTASIRAYPSMRHDRGMELTDMT
jgi:acetyl-CoA carboxylase carboxyltransferase component